VIFSERRLPGRCSFATGHDAQLDVRHHPAHCDNEKEDSTMFSKLVKRFVKDPTMYYSMSIAATWAGVGSLMNGITMVREYGIAPFLIWAFGNTMACILFGIFAPTIPKLRDVMRSKAMKYIVGFMCIFQIWLNMNGAHLVFEDTVLGASFGMYLAYAVAIGFILFLLVRPMIRSVLTDHMEWTAVYVIALLVTVGAIIYSMGNMRTLSWGLEWGNLSVGIEKCVLLLPGAFLYPYFFEILDYNDANEDGTKKINVRRSFVTGGLLFGAYLTFTFLLAWTHFSPVLNLIKAGLIALIAVSTISSFIYGIYITFGRKLGIVINVACVATWQFLIPLGVMGAWTLMSQIRIWIVLGAIAFSVVWARRERGCQNKRTPEKLQQPLEPPNERSRG